MKNELNEKNKIRAVIFEQLILNNLCDNFFFFSLVKNNGERKRKKENKSIM